MTETVPERRPKNLRPFDYHHEKVALTRLARWLAEQGWEVGLSVSPKKAASDGELGGEAPVEMDDEFIRRFNSDDEWRFRYTFYYDQPGNFDLVARRDGVVLIVEAKGRSATNKRGAIARLIGGLSLERDPAKSGRRYAILLPEGPAWDKWLRNYGGLDWLQIYRIGAPAPGEIREDSWANYEHTAEVMKPSH